MNNIKALPGSFRGSRQLGQTIASTRHTVALRVKCTYDIHQFQWHSYSSLHTHPPNPNPTRCELLNSRSLLEELS